MGSVSFSPRARRARHPLFQSRQCCWAFRPSWRPPSGGPRFSPRRWAGSPTDGSGAVVGPRWSVAGHCPTPGGSSFACLPKGGPWRASHCCGGNVAETHGEMPLLWCARAGTRMLCPLQVGVAIRHRTVAIVHTVRNWVQRHAGRADHVLLKIDFSNAFNTVDRASLLRETQLRLPGLSRCCSKEPHWAPRRECSKETLLAPSCLLWPCSQPARLLARALQTCGLPSWWLTWTMCAWPVHTDKSALDWSAWPRQLDKLAYK